MYAFCCNKLINFCPNITSVTKKWNLETQTFLTMCFVKTRKGFDHKL